MLSHRSLKICGVFICLTVFASIVWSMAHWNEARGVYDDICYLRQAHLFQRFGLSGIDTNLARDDDGYFSAKVREIGLSGQATICHTLMPAAHKSVLQYPPGTGFVLAMFPAGFQVVPLNISATTLVLIFALLAIYLAGTTFGIIAASAFGSAAVYFMINPAKASYSVAPTMVVCAMAGFLTAWLSKSRQLSSDRARGEQLLVTFSLGLLLGLSVNFRLPNLFLAAGYCTFFLIAFMASRRPDTFLQGGIFGVTLLAGIVPTLWANAVNAGSPLSTTYDSDASPMDFSFSAVPQYFTDLQGVLLILAAAWAVTLICRRVDGSRPVALIVTVNLLVSGTYFMTHTVVTPYYILPLTMLSLWSLLFDYLMQIGSARLAGLPR